MIDVSFWFMFPVGFIIATIAMMSGIGGAILFSPFFILVLKLDPLLAIASGLFIEMFGFTSGVIGYILKKDIDFSVVKKLIIFSVPATILGVVLGRFVDVIFLKGLLAILLLYLSYKFLIGNKKDESNPDKNIDNISKLFPFIGGLLVGLISSGLGELDEYTFLKRLKMKAAIASGTSVFLVAMSAIVGVISHLFFIIKTSNTQVFLEASSIILFAIPGVVIGAQAGVYVVQRLSLVFMRYFLGFLFLLCGVMMGLTLF